MAYYVLKSKGKVVDVLSDDSKTTPNVNKLLSDGKIDSVEKVANFDDLKSIIFPGGATDHIVFPDGVADQDEHPLDRIVRKLTTNAEGFLDDLSKKLERITSENKSVSEIAKRAKAAGQTVLKEVREIHTKALEKTKKKKK